MLSLHHNISLSHCYQFNFSLSLFSFFLKLGTLFQPNDNISMLFCCHRTNLPLTLPIFLTPHIFCNSPCTYICIFPAFVFLPPLYFCQDSCPASKAYICVCCGSLAACWHSQRGILILRGQHLFPPKNRKFNDQEVQIYAHSNLHKCPTIQMRLFKCLEIKSIDSVESLSHMRQNVLVNNWLTAIGLKLYFFIFFFFLCCNYFRFGILTYIFIYSFDCTS